MRGSTIAMWKKESGQWFAGAENARRAERARKAKRRLLNVLSLCVQTFRAMPVNGWTNDSMDGSRSGEKASLAR